MSSKTFLKNCVKKVSKSLRQFMYSSIRFPQYVIVNQIKISLHHKTDRYPHRQKTVTIIHLNESNTYCFRNKICYMSGENKQGKYWTGGKMYKPPSAHTCVTLKPACFRKWPSLETISWNLSCCQFTCTRTQTHTSRCEWWERNDSRVLRHK